MWVHVSIDIWLLEHFIDSFFSETNFSRHFQEVFSIRLNDLYNHVENNLEQFEQHHDKSNKMTCASSEDSGTSAQSDQSHRYALNR